MRRQNVDMPTEDCAPHPACRNPRESASCASALWRAATRQAAEGCAKAGGAAATVPTRLPLRGSRANAKTTGRVTASHLKVRKWSGILLLLPLLAASGGRSTSEMTEACLEMGGEEEEMSRIE